VRPYCAKISDLAQALKRYYQLTWTLCALPKAREPTVLVDWDNLDPGGKPAAGEDLSAKPAAADPAAVAEPPVQSKAPGREPRRRPRSLPPQEDEVAEAVIEALRGEGRPATSSRARPTLTWTLGRLEHAADRLEIGELCTAHAAGLCGRAALFMLRGQTVSGWLGAGELTRRQVRSVLLPLREPSVFQAVLEKRAPYRGNVPRTRLNALLLATLGGYEPVEVVLQPLVAQGQIFCILYGDRRSERFAPAEIQELELVADAAARAFGRLLERLLAVGTEPELRLAPFRPAGR